jgi:hypothetical protein
MGNFAIFFPKDVTAPVFLALISREFLLDSKQLLIEFNADSHPLIFLNGGRIAPIDVKRQ